MRLTELKALLKKGEKIVHRIPHEVNGIVHREKLYMIIDGREEEFSPTVISDLGDCVKEVDTKDQTLKEYVWVNKSKKIESTAVGEGDENKEPPKKVKKAVKRKSKK